MSRSPTKSAPSALAATLVVRRQIRATTERLFAAWTRPELLVCWWGAAEIDLRVGGRYRIANRFPDGSTIWIGGVFEAIEAPHRLIYTWQLESHGGPAERVIVRFISRGELTEVEVTHERIPNDAARTSHERGWVGCLDGLVRYMEQP
jgi:uncharacterized protein YndB with AHSA1/START domain